MYLSYYIILGLNSLGSPLLANDCGPVKLEGRTDIYSTRGFIVYI